jgi:hypothetical protein
MVRVFAFILKIKGAEMFCWPLQGTHVEHVVNNLVTIKKLIHMVDLL